MEEKMKEIDAGTFMKMFVAISYLQEQRIIDYGDIYDFIKMVERGSIIDDDGTGCISDGKYMYYDIEVDVEWLLDQAQTYKYVCWFNK